MPSPILTSAQRLATLTRDPGALRRLRHDHGVVEYWIECPADGGTDIFMIGSKGFWQTLAVCESGYAQSMHGWHGHGGAITAAQLFYWSVFHPAGRPPAPWRFHGHSWGAAESIATAAMLARAFPGADVSATLFGCPRVLCIDALPAVHGHVQVQSYRNGNDPVPLMPFLLGGALGLYHQSQDFVQIGTATPWPYNSHHIAAYAASLAERY